MKKVTYLLVEACQIMDLVVISQALDTFYDIYSEAYYNKCLVDLNVLEMMETGYPAL